MTSYSCSGNGPTQKAIHPIQPWADPAWASLSNGRKATVICPFPAEHLRHLHTRNSEMHGRLTSEAAREQE